MKELEIVSAVTESSRRSKVALLAAAALIAGICLLVFVTRAREQTGDSLSYALSAHDGKNLFHPHHLLFNFTVRLVYLLFAGASNVDVLLAGQLHNLAFLALGLVAAYLIARDSLGSHRFGLLGVVCFAALNGVFVYTTQIEVYVPAIACLMMATAIFLRGTSNWGNVFGVVLFWSLGVLYHQTGVLFAVPVLVFLLARKAYLRALAITSGATVLVLAAYLAVYHFEGYEDRSFLEFCLWYVERGRSTWGNLSNLGLSGLGDLVKSQWWALSAWPWGPAAAFLLGGVLLFSVAASLLPHRGDARPLALLRFALVWYLAYGLFFWWWLPTEVEFCILMSAPLMLVLLAMLRIVVLRDRRHGILVAALAALVCMAYTLRAEVLPRHRDYGTAYHRASDLHEADTGFCLVLARHPVLTTFRFYFEPNVRRSFEISRAFQLVAAGENSRWRERSPGCLVLLGRDLQPNSWHLGIVGSRTPRPWLRFVAWALDIERCPTGDGLCSGSFRWSRGTAGEIILVIDDEKRRFEDGMELFAEFAGSLAPLEPDYSKRLLAWQEKNEGLLNGLTGGPREPQR